MYIHGKKLENITGTILSYRRINNDKHLFLVLHDTAYVV